ncbi:hypothetical protein MTO96_008499 [Rhipicephalus appendiculatus]
MRSSVSRAGSSPFPGLAACLPGSSPFDGGSRSCRDGSPAKDVSDILAYAKWDEDGSRLGEREKQRQAYVYCTESADRRSFRFYGLSCDRLVGEPVQSSHGRDDPACA